MVETFQPANVAGKIETLCYQYHHQHPGKHNGWGTGRQGDGEPSYSSCMAHAGSNPARSTTF